MKFVSEIVVFARCVAWVGLFPLLSYDSQKRKCGVKVNMVIIMVTIMVIIIVIIMVIMVIMVAIVIRIFPGM